MFNLFLFWFLLVILIMSKKVKTLKLLFLIILMSINLALIFFFQNISFLGLMWCLVYLGGMMIIFVYVSFITMEKNNLKMIKENKDLISFILFNFTFLMSMKNFFFFKKIKILMTKFFFSNNNSNLEMVNWEVYNQILISSPVFIYILLILIGFSLILIMGLLKKSNLLINNMNFN